MNANVFALNFQVEDVSEETTAARHERGGIEEAKRYEKNSKLPHHSRIRHSRRTDSRTDSGANTPGIFSYCWNLIILTNLGLLMAYFSFQIQCRPTRVILVVIQCRQSRRHRQHLRRHKIRSIPTLITVLVLCKQFSDVGQFLRQCLVCRERSRTLL